jgi:hypothetical protein
MLEQAVEIGRHMHDPAQPQRPIVDNYTCQRGLFRRDLATLAQKLHKECRQPIAISPSFRSSGSALSSRLVSKSPRAQMKIDRRDLIFCFAVTLGSLPVTPFFTVTGNCTSQF